jgi:hypothetical protein
MNLPGGLVAVVMAAVLSAVPAASWARQTGAPSSPATSAQPAERPPPRADSEDTDQALPPPDAVPVSLTRIRRALASPPALKVLEPAEVRDGRPVFRVDVEADKVDIQTILGKDFLRGPVSYGGMTHQEFLDLVTPDDVKGYAAFSNGQGMVVAATSIALQWAVLKAIDTFKKAKDARARDEARKEVEEALEALRRARRAAGLPDK